MSDIYATASPDRKHPNRLWRQPERKSAVEVLEQHPDEAFKRSQQSTVHDYRTLGLPVLGDVAEVESLRPRQLLVKLHRPQLPGASQAVEDMQVDLRAVEGALAGALVER
jgi:hypothetical protein